MSFLWISVVISIMSRGMARLEEDASASDIVSSYSDDEEEGTLNFPIVKAVFLVVV